MWQSFLAYRDQHAMFVNCTIFVLLVVASGLLGNWLAKVLRTAGYGWKFAVILFSLLASLVVIIFGWPPRLGVDLGGGSILVFKVDETKTDWRPDKMDSLLVSIGKRVNPGGQKEISVRSLGTDMVEIVMPSISGSTAKEKQAEADEIRKIIRTTGALEFRIVATRRDNESLIEMARAERKKIAAVEPKEAVKIRDPKTGKVLAKWCRVREQEVGKVKSDPGFADAAMMVGTVKDTDKKTGKEYDKEVWEVLVLEPESEAYNVTGIDVRDARTGVDPETARPDVLFSFNASGGVKFGRVTGEHVPIGDFQYHLAIVLDDVLQTAPTIRSQITDNGQITGDFTQTEVNEIVQIINAGSLPAALDPTPVRDMTTDATLGKDTIRQSTYAMIIASIVVPLFMLYYYRFAGIIAVLELGLNMLILVAMMILIKAPFTLPALAGLALTVGMAVDNNVLIYERLREEIAHGAALRMAIRNAFHRVGVVIVDANITHLIAATVLWSVGTEQIKGFAVTFWLGAVLSIWATMFVARVMFEVSERRRWVQKLDMMQWIGHTKIDFMAWFPACATFSVLITVFGIVVAGVRGKGLFDIDFTGGVSVQTVFQEKQDIEKIRAQIDAINKQIPDATVTPAHSEDEPNDQRFIIDTSNPDNENVKNTLKDLFEKNNEKLVALEITAKVGAPAKVASPGEKPREKPPETPAAATGSTPIPLGTVEEKPSQPPVDKSKPAAESRAQESGNKSSPAINPKTTATTPAGTAPADAKSRDTANPSNTTPANTGKPASSAKPAETAIPASTAKPANTANTAKPADTAKPTASKQSRWDLPPLSLVAMNGPEAFLLAQADAKPQTADTKAAAKSVPKSDPKPDNKASTTPEPKPQAESPAKTTSEKAPAATTKAEKVETGAAANAAAPAFEATLNLWSRVAKLKDGNPSQVEQVDQLVRYDQDRLQKVIEQVLKERGISAEIQLTSLDPDRPKKSDRWLLKLVPITPSQNALTPASFQKVLTTLESEVRSLPYFPIEDNIGSAVANDTRFWAVVALVSSWSLIIGYLWIRFQGVAFGLAAVIALIHDVLVMLGAIAFSSYLAQIPGLTTLTLIEPFKINLPIVAAFLTIIGYSVNDTIVVFDRIREIRGKSPTLTRQMVNDATNQTLSRTVLTSFTVMLVVIILYIFGGQAVHGFAFALIIGVLTGTYSSIYVAAPILLWLLHPKEMRADTTAGETVGSR